MIEINLQTRKRLIYLALQMLGEGKWILKK